MQRIDYSRRCLRIQSAILIALVLLMLIISFFSEFIAPNDPYKQDLQNALQEPCSKYPFGTDRYGRYILSRVITGARTTLFSSLFLVLITSSTGSLLGFLSGCVGGRIDALIMRLTDMFLAFPGLVFAIAIASVLGGGMSAAVFSLAIVSWPKYARISRSQVLTAKNSAYVQAAKISGCRQHKIVLMHILPNVLGYILITAAMDIGVMIMELSGLSYLGLGASSPTAEWGSMISESKSLLQIAPWVLLAPGCAIFISVMIFNLLGDTIRDILDSKQKYHL